ncbi:MAG TPA: mandelate racemase/muconate lactonizing enzyme family protein [Casimicrobiaceae bacterium]
MPTIVDIAVFSGRISEKTTWTFVRVRDAAGRYGWGEATLQGEASAVHANVARLTPAITGRALPRSIETSAMVGTCGESLAEAAAISAIDQALWDLSAQERHQPLVNVLGNPCRTTIELYANINRGTLDRTPSGFAARAREATSRGFNAIKIAPFDDARPETAAGAAGRRLLAAGIERVNAVRASIGEDRKLLVDCHWRLTEASASEVLRELESSSLYWFECPLLEEPSMFPALRRLRSQANDIGVRLAGCETLIGFDAFQSFLDADVYDVIMPDVKYTGGLVETLRIGEAASARGTLCSPHNPSGPIAHAHSVHVSALLPSFPFLEFQYEESPLFFDLLHGELPDPRGGTSALPTSHGLGVGVNLTRLPEWRTA